MKEIDCSKVFDIDNDRKTIKFKPGYSLDNFYRNNKLSRKDGILSTVDKSHFKLYESAGKASDTMQKLINDDLISKARDFWIHVKYNFKKSLRKSRKFKIICKIDKEKEKIAIGLLIKQIISLGYGSTNTSLQKWNM